MDIITILKANIRHQKGSFCSIFILMFMVSLALTAVLTISINSKNSDEQALEQAGFGDMMVVLNPMEKEEMDALVKKVREHDEVERVQEVEAIAVTPKEINGSENGNSLLMERYNDSYFQFRIFNENGTGFIEEPEELKVGEVYVPICYSNKYNCRVGEKISFKMQNETVEYTIKGFFQDPFMGGIMMGIKTVLASDADMERISAEMADGTNKEMTESIVLNIFQKKSSELSYLKFEQKLNKDTGVTGFGWISMGKDQAMGYMLMLTNIFSGSLLVFVVLLLIITLIIMSHSIGSSIEMEYVNLGILKAVGITQGKLKVVLVLQYLLGAFLGVLLGVPMALPVIGGVNQITTPVVGILTPNQLAWLPCMGALFGIFGFIILFIYLKLRKLKEITPVRAICNGKEEIYFSSRIQLPIQRKGMQFWVAFRQLTSNGKQYVSACVITGLLVFFLIMAGHMSAWMGEDGGEFAKVFEATGGDLKVFYGEQNLRGEIEEKIENDAKMKDSYQLNSEYLILDGSQMFCYICDKPEMFQAVQEGRTCKYDNEILITSFVAENLGLKVGDRVKIGLKDKEAEYMVSGIYQCANDMGRNFAMSKAGYERIGKERPMMDIYFLEQNEKTKDIAKELNDTYGARIKASANDNFEGMETIVSGVDALSILVYILALIFVLVVISMVCGKIFVRERQDYGIYKAMGFTSGKLRLQFAFRFVIVSLIGSVFGILLSVLLMNGCFEIMLSYVGISQMETELEWMAVVAPAGMMAVVFFLFSYWKAGRIKKVQPRVLITE